MRSALLLPSARVFGLFLLLAGSAVAQTGALTQLPGTDACISEDGSDGACADGVGLNAAVGLAVSRDGRNVYVTSFIGDAVAVLARDRSRRSLAAR